MSTPEYETWKQQPTPENLSKVLVGLQPVIVSEAQRYTGPKPLLRSRAKSLAIKAIRTYDPTQGAQLRSWVTTQLQPLSRYSHQLKPVKPSEIAVRQAAEIERVRKEMLDDLGRHPSAEELSDEIGLSPKKIKKLQAMVRPTISEGGLAEPSDEDSTPSLPGVSTANKLNTAEETVYMSLSKRDQAIFDMKTGRHGQAVLSNQDIAARLGVTPALISQRSSQMGLQIQDLMARGLV